MASKQPRKPDQPRGSLGRVEDRYCPDCRKTRPHTLSVKRADGITPMTCTVCRCVSFKLPVEV